MEFLKSYGDLAVFNYGSKHLLLRAVRLVTNTDKNDTLVEERSIRAFGNVSRELEGQIFLLTDEAAGVTEVIIVPAPDRVIPTAVLKGSELTVRGFGYPIFSRQCAAGQEERTVRLWYRQRYTPSTLHAMSNTWGDRNGRSRVCDGFIRREIESGADLGLDVVQIDDGWQRGVPEVYDGDGNRLFEGDFWELKDEIFPEGMATLSDYARSLGVELGLWFAPHSCGAFEHMERDISVLRRAYSEWGIRYFKLDMVSLPTEEHCAAMTELIRRVMGLGDGVSVELDVTADKRLGYLAAAPYGTIFVENRYTAWGNYYPHRTLRNLWMLSRYIPAAKLQMELVNPELCTDKYSFSDPYRHELYTADYLFASVMVSNPLFWMETQFLSEGARAALKSIIPLWRRYRGELTCADVRPVGEEPCGAALTGFIAEDTDYMHIILLRENTDRDMAKIDTGAPISSVKVIRSDAPAHFSVEGSTVTATFSKPRSYIWLRAEKV